MQRMWDEGHEIGNHTFTHPNLGACSPARTRLELVATQRSIESILGRSTRLFRPPYNADAEPTSAEEVKPIEIASDLGYLTVGEYLDPQDWNLTESLPDGSPRTRTAADIARDVIDDVHTGHGNTILLHDGGGDRSRTAAALALFVPQLRAEGYRFVTVSALIGTSRADVMPRDQSRRPPADRRRSRRVQHAVRVRGVPALRVPRRHRARHRARAS